MQERSGCEQKERDTPEVQTGRPFLPDPMPAEQARPVSLDEIIDRIQTEDAVQEVREPFNVPKDRCHIEEHPHHRLQEELDVFDECDECRETKRECVDEHIRRNHVIRQLQEFPRDRDPVRDNDDENDQ